MSLKHPKYSNVLSGTIDRFVPPRTLVGWVVNKEKIGHGHDISITISMHGSLIGEGRPQLPRLDIVDRTDYLVGFRIVCTEDIQEEAIAFQFILAEAIDASGNMAKLRIYDRIRYASFTRLISSYPHMGKESVAAILAWLSQNPNISAENSTALLSLSESVSEQRNASDFVEQATPLAPAIANASIDTLEPSEVMMQFSSLGWDCTFGTVQRRLNVEPIGLLRFAGVPIESVTKALENRLNEVGSPDYTRLTLDENREYWLSDTRYGMHSHTFVFEGEIQREKFYAKQCKRLSFLARLLIEDIEEARKIFVVHNLPDDLDLNSLARLFTAIQKIGPANLLYVRPTTDPDLRGNVWREEGWLVGGLDLVGSSPANPSESMCNDWLQICRAALNVVGQASLI